jgi:hypothetical protein
VSQSKRARKDVYEERLAVYNSERHLIEGVRETVAGHSTIHLMGLTERGKPRPVGSGVLFSSGGKLFILTAAHVVDEFRGKPAFLRCGPKLLNVTGRWHASVYPEFKTRKDDVLDFAVMSIDGEAGEVLNSFAIMAADVFNPPKGVLLGKGLVIVGFPARNFKMDSSELYCEGAGMETHGVGQETYEKVGVDPDDHQLMRWYNTMYSSKGVVRSPSLAGMSGGGVWLVPELMGESFPASAPWTQPKLIGIFTEHRKARSVLLATKVHCHLDKIIEKYPELPLGLRYRLFSGTGSFRGRTGFPPTPTKCFAASL